MSDPKRLAELGIGNDLLASAKADGPSPAARARAAAAIGLGVGAGAATTSATTKAAAATTKATLKLAGAGLWTKVIAAGAVTAAVAGGSAMIARESRDPSALPAAAASANAGANADGGATSYAPARGRADEIPAPEPIQAAPPVLETGNAASGAKDIAAHGAHGASAHANEGIAAAGPSALTREVRAIDGARSALDRGDAAGALSALDQHDRDFPTGTLRTEADVLRVDALVAKGNRSAAKVLAQQLLARDPSSAHAKHLRGVVGEEN